MYCLNCGELWHDCICIPWCWNHDSMIPCNGCAREEQIRLEKIEMLKPFMVPWYMNLFSMLLGKYNE